MDSRVDDRDCAESPRRGTCGARPTLEQPLTRSLATKILLDYLVASRKTQAVKLRSTPQETNVSVPGDPTLSPAFIFQEPACEKSNVPLDRGRRMLYLKKDCA